MPTDPTTLLAATRCDACSPPGEWPFIRLGLLRELLFGINPLALTECQTVLDTGKCYSCYTPGEWALIKLALWRKVVLQQNPAADVSPGSVIAASKCYVCYSSGIWNLLEIALIREVIPSTTSTDDLIALVSCCFCLTPGEVDIVELVMLRELLLQLDPLADVTPETLLNEVNCYLCYGGNGFYNLLVLGILKKKADEGYITAGVPGLWTDGAGNVFTNEDGDGFYFVP